MSAADGEAEPGSGPSGWGWADLHAWETLRPLLAAGPYLPWSEGALRPSALAKVASEIVLGELRSVVELGSGLSTVILARLLRERGGELYCVEHDPAWARFVRGQIEREGLGGLARLIESPLEGSDLGLDGTPWYAEEPLAALPQRIDLLLVDGPPGYGDKMARSRYPALPLLRGRLAPRALVVLDDAARPGEREIIERWQREYELEFGLMRAEGIALARVPVP